MEEGYEPKGEIVKVAEAAIKGMITAVNKEMISPHVMIDAALHVLAAWVASSQTHAPTGEREEEVEECGLIAIHEVAPPVKGRLRSNSANRIGAPISPRGRVLGAYD